MITPLSRMLALAIAATLPAHASAPPAAPHAPDTTSSVRWTAANATYRISWTTNDIVAIRVDQARPVFSFRDFAKAGLDAVARFDGVRLTRYHDVAVISLTGSLLALRDTVNHAPSHSRSEG